LPRQASCLCRSEPNPISGRQNEVFARPLDGYGKRGKSFAECEDKREIDGQIRVVLRLFLLTLFAV